MVGITTRNQRTSSEQSKTKRTAGVQAALAGRIAIADVLRNPMRRRRATFEVDHESHDRRRRRRSRFDAKVYGRPKATTARFETTRNNGPVPIGSDSYVGRRWKEHADATSVAMARRSDPVGQHRSPRKRHLRRMKTKLLAIALLIGLTIGCERPKPLPQWHVKLIRPDGSVHRSWFVGSRTEPVGKPLWGGQIELHYDQGSLVGSGEYKRRYRSANIMAPTGWIFDCEPIEQEFGRSIVEH